MTTPQAFEDQAIWDACARQRFASRFLAYGVDSETLELLPDYASPPPSGGEYKYVYLDLKDWIGIAKARARRPDGERYARSYALLQQAVRRGSVLVPLSGTHYMELANIGDVKQRKALADVMAELSRFSTLAHYRPRLTSEVDAALHKLLGRPMFPQQLQPFGLGVRFALGIDYGPPGRILSKEPLPNHIDEREIAATERLFNVVSEYMLLRGPAPADIAAMPEYDRSVSRGIAQQRAGREQELTELLKLEKPRFRQIADIVHARILYSDLRDSLPALLDRAGLTAHSFLAKGKEWLTEFMESVPAVAIQTALTAQMVKNASREWSDNDIYDIDALAAAVPYCDVVLTERFACDVLNRTGLAKRFRTSVIRAPERLEEWLLTSAEHDRQDGERSRPDSNAAPSAQRAARSRGPKRFILDGAPNPPRLTFLGSHLPTCRAASDFRESIRDDSESRTAERVSRSAWYWLQRESSVANTYPALINSSPAGDRAAVGVSRAGEWCALLEQGVDGGPAHPKSLSHLGNSQQRTDRAGGCWRLVDVEGLLSCVGESPHG